MVEWYDTYFGMIGHFAAISFSDARATTICL